jgi:hypothetical protein
MMRRSAILVRLLEIPLGFALGVRGIVPATAIASEKRHDN